MKTDDKIQLMNNWFEQEINLDTWNRIENVFKLIGAFQNNWHIEKIYLYHQIEFVDNNMELDGIATWSLETKGFGFVIKDESENDVTDLLNGLKIPTGGNLFDGTINSQKFNIKIKNTNSGTIGQLVSIN